MPRLLTLFLMLHWATVFSLLAAFSAFDAGGIEGLRAFGIDVDFAPWSDGNLLIFRAAISFAFTICAVLFCWSFATLLLSLRGEPGHGDDVLRVAFSAAACLMTLIVLTGAVARAHDLLPVMATHVAALIASYVAIQSELSRPRNPDAMTEERLRLAARVRALGASHVAAFASPAVDRQFHGRDDR